MYVYVPPTQWENSFEQTQLKPYFLVNTKNKYKMQYITERVINSEVLKPNMNIWFRTHFISPSSDSSIGSHYYTRTLCQMFQIESWLFLRVTVTLVSSNKDPTLHHHLSLTTAYHSILTFSGNDKWSGNGFSVITTNYLLALHLFPDVYSVLWGEYTLTHRLISYITLNMTVHEKYKL